MGSRSLVALLVALCACRPGVRAAGRSKVNPRIITAPQGESCPRRSASVRSCRLLPVPVEPWHRVEQGSSRAPRGSPWLCWGWRAPSSAVLASALGSAGAGSSLGSPNPSLLFHPAVLHCLIAVEELAHPARMGWGLRCHVPDPLVGASGALAA
ncbi:Semaphorin-7A isoform X1 [Aix galericulata]|nr:Semaphorin-7A isoform X1 [Aix galericulata]